MTVRNLKTPQMEKQAKNKFDPICEAVLYKALHINKDTNYNVIYFR